jgi:SAM-dependent methyltransferase
MSGMTVHSFYPESRFGGFTDVDGTVRFYSRLRALITAESVVADVGCGRGARSEDDVSFRRDLTRLRGRCRSVIGIDVDAAAANNPAIDEFRPIPDGRWPLQDASVDVAFADWVLEHVDDPRRFFAEAARAVKPGGYFCARTANKWGYVSVASRLIPNRLHQRVLSRVQAHRAERDVFPTRYRCNTRAVLTKLLRETGFSDHVVYGYEAEPSYLSFSRVAYAVGVLHQRLAPRAIKAALFVFARRDS